MEGFNLPERGFSVGNLNNEIKASLIGTFAKRFTNQFRSRISFNKSENVTNSQGVGITVSGAFNIGSSGVDNSSHANKFEAFEMLSTEAGKHFIKFGGEIHFESFNFNSSDGTNGNFFFNSLSSYTNGKPSAYSRADRDTSASFEREDLSLFVQDEYRIAEKIQIGLGLRYEIQNHLSDKNNFPPRLSAALAFDGNAKFVLISGTGVLYRWHKANNIQHILKNDGGQSEQIVILNPGFPNPEDGGILRESLPPSIYRQANDLRNPYMFVTQTALNMNLGSGVKFDASYKFERGIHMFRSRDINAPLNGVRPNQKFGRIIQLESRGMFTRNSFEVSGQGILFKRIGVNGRYRLSKAIDDFSALLVCQWIIII